MGMIVVNAMTKVRERGGRWILLGENLWPVPYPNGACFTSSFNPLLPWNVVNWPSRWQTPITYSYNKCMAYGNGYYVIGTATTLANCISYATDLLGVWTTVSTPLDTGGPNDLIYANGYWVAVGIIPYSTQKLITATDPTGTWTNNASVTSIYLRCLAYGNNYFLAGNYSNGNILHATDPTAAWTTKTTGLTSVNSITYGNGYYVAVGSAGKIAYTTDPSLGWTTISIATTKILNKVKYGNGYFTAVGANGTLVYATDPASWTISSIPYWLYTNLSFIEYGKDGYWIAGGSDPLQTHYNMLSYIMDVPTGTWLEHQLYWTSYPDQYRVLVPYNLYNL